MVYEDSFFCRSLLWLSVVLYVFSVDSWCRPAVDSRAALRRPGLECRRCDVRHRSLRDLGSQSRCPPMWLRLQSRCPHCTSHLVRPSAAGVRREPSSYSAGARCSMPVSWFGSQCTPYTRHGLPVTVSGVRSALREPAGYSAGAVHALHYSPLIRVPVPPSRVQIFIVKRFSSCDFRFKKIPKLQLIRSK